MKPTTNFSVLAQPGNLSVADKDGADFGVAAIGWWRHFKIENANPPTLFSIVGTTIAGSNHHPLFGSLFSPQINHGVRDRRVAIDVVGATPKEQIAGLKRIELECILVAAQYRIEISRFTHPDILLAGIARH